MIGSAIGWAYVRIGLLGALGVSLAAPAAVAAGSFVEFESGQVRPLALSPDGSRLFAVNTPDDRLEIFAVGDAGLAHASSVVVGLEPVAVAARSATEVWVVNHLSDSVSIVDVGADPPRVVRTLLVGDEPRDIVFAGPDGARAFITAAHRGQNNPNDPQLTTPSIGRADVWVFDADALGSSLGGVPLAIVTLYGDTPRALATSPDGATVYAAVFHSGNRTTSVAETLVCDGGASAAPCTINGTLIPGGLPAPNATLVDQVPGPETGLIVRYDGSHWLDPLGRSWDSAVRFSLPDEDVFAIDASADPPVQTAAYAGVGTILFNLAVNPISGAVYVTNSDAHNEVRFEGPGGGGSTVRGHLHEARISVLAGGQVAARHLNKHIDYAVVPSPAGTKEKSLALPLGMAVSSDGTTLYVAAFGSSKIGVFDTAALEDDRFVPDAASQIALSGGGPTGVVLDEPRRRLYALTRFDDGIAVVDLTTRVEVDHVALYDPEPYSVVKGRPFLYDATLTSSNGEAACASCHIFADFDSLAWDLGNPDASPLPNPNPFRDRDQAPPPGPSAQQSGDLVRPAEVEGAGPDFHPLKGPMVTQSLRGLANHGPMHWRGDRTGGNDPGGDPLDENAALLKFDAAFADLLGRAEPLNAPEMQALADFVLQITYPPNPIRALDNSLNDAQQRGRDLFFGPIVDGMLRCHDCHRLDPAAGFFGSDGFSSSEGEAQKFKIPHLRNLYQKVGMFGMPSTPFFHPGDNGDQGPQVRGFGYSHDGSLDTVFRFTTALGFEFSDDAQRRDVVQFLLAMDSNLAPIVGQQITLSDGNAATAGPRIDLLIARAAAGECDVVVKGVVNGEQRGWYRDPDGAFRSDRAHEPLLDGGALRALAAVAAQPLTYTCVPPGSGRRIGVDRDEDGHFDRDELDDGSDPAMHPTSTPTSTPTATTTPTPTATTTPTATRSASPTPTAAPLVGDCNGDRAVTIDELLMMVNMALGIEPVGMCRAGDASHDGRITIDELTRAVMLALGA